jgi:hypothetical protein
MRPPGHSGFKVSKAGIGGAKPPLQQPRLT